MMLSLLYFIVLLHINSTFGYTTVINNLEIFRENVVTSLDFIRDAYVPRSLDTAIAYGLSEGVSGSISGLISRGATNVIGIKKIDSLKTKVTTTGAFFGTRGLIRVFGRVLGLPGPLIIVLASLFASIISEITKANGRNADNADKIIHNEFMNQQTLDYPEILGDIAKWLVYDILYTTHQRTQHHSISNDLNLQSFDIMITSSTNFNDYYISFITISTKLFQMLTNEQIMISFLYGGFAAIVGLLITKSINFSNELINYMFGYNGRIESSKQIRQQIDNIYLIKAIEGGILFASFQYILSLLVLVVPEQYNLKFAFNSVLQEVLEGDTLN